MYLLVISVLVTALSAYICQLYWHSVRYWQHQNVTSPKRHWFWGHFEGLRRNESFATILHHWYQQYQGAGLPFLRIYAFIEPVVLITDPKLAKRILIRDFGHFQNRGLYYNPHDLSANLFTLDYEQWKMFRTKLSPTFTSGKMKALLPKFVNAAHKLVDVMQEDLDRGTHILPVKNLMHRFTIEIIGSCAFDIQANSLINPNGEFSKMAYQASLGEENSALAKLCMFCLPSVARLLRLSYMPKYLIGFYTGLVRNILTSREQQKDRHNDVMDTLKDMRNNANAKLNLQEITAQTLIFFQAGFETSASALTYALYELARHQDIQRKARQEIYTILEKHNNVLSSECWNEMKYLEQIIKETLRLYPITPTINRQCTKDYKIPGTTNVFIQKGQMLAIPVFSFHRDEQFYKDANTFNPDNFASDRSDNIFLTFGDGPRNCIGMRFAYMQIWIGLIMLLQNFSFEFCSKSENPIEFKETSVLLLPKNEIFLNVNKYKCLHEGE